MSGNIPYEIIKEDTMKVASNAPLTRMFHKLHGRFQWLSLTPRLRGVVCEPKCATASAILNCLSKPMKRSAFPFFLLLLTGGFIIPLDAWSDGVCQTVTLSPPHFLIAGGNPDGVVVADFNGDSNQDFVVANAGGGITVYLGDGLGGFGSANTFAVNGFPHAPVAGDFNGDSKLDLVVPNGAHTISVLLNNGSGGFGAQTIFEVGDSPRSVGVGDFNGDNKLDLAVVNGLSDNISILLGNGAGGFGSATNFPAGDGPNGIAVGDFNGDNKLDLAVSTYDSMEVKILLGDGTGKFTAGTSYPMPGNAGAILAAHFNGDNHLDLAVSVFNIFPNNHVTILVGNGDGTFTPGDQIAVQDATGLAASDFNRDGNLDLAIATYSSGTVAVALGDGAGNFGAPTNFRVQRRFPIDVAVGDFNADGKPDLVTANYEGNDASVLLNVPKVKIRAFDASASEPGTNVGWFQVTRTGCTTEPLLVHYTWGGTARPARDYKGLSGHVTIPAGKVAANIKVTPFDDAIAEPAKTVSVTLSGNPYYSVGAMNSATVTISDND
jgi:hypothetical protein